MPSLSFVLRHGEAVVIATTMHLPSSNYSSTMTTPLPRWSLTTCTSNFLSPSFLPHYNALPLSPPFSGSSPRQRRTCHMVMISTLHTQLTSTQAALATEQCHSARQRDVLEKAMEQLARET